MTISDDDVPHGTKKKRTERTANPQVVGDCQPGDVVIIKAWLGNFKRGHRTVFCRAMDGSGPYPLDVSWPIEREL